MPTCPQTLANYPPRGKETVKGSMQTRNREHSPSRWKCHLLNLVGFSCETLWTFTLEANIRSGVRCTFSWFTIARLLVSVFHPNCRRPQWSFWSRTPFVINFRVTASNHLAHWDWMVPHDHQECIYTSVLNLHSKPFWETSAVATKSTTQTYCCQQHCQLELAPS